MNTDCRPLGYPLVLDGVVLIHGDVAAPLLALLDAGLRNRKADGYRLTDQEDLVVRSLEMLARLHRGERQTMSVSPIVWMSLRLAAERVGVSVEAVRQAAKRGTLTSHRRGRRIEVTESSVGSWIESRDFAA